ncbi:MAG: type 2 isopentenyl-diphosphate Delta-isomerase [Crocinitomicaceae bacterium]|nr:type 2 isopentenyl-diphosphate Delta-isomerase [Crocinitomicaceae bacterium]
MEKIEHESLEAADSRKQSHLDLAFKSQSAELDKRFYYEPMLSGHPAVEEEMSFKLGDKVMKYPIWISSMTGGTSKAGPINKMLAKTAGKYGFGMGLGSCRIILEDNTYFEDFNLRPILGDEVPLFANVGIAQIERILQENQGNKLTQLVEKLSADGLIVHVNPLQEWLQPEGDLIQQSPLVTIEQLLNEFDKPIIVKEVGQGFGPHSMGELLKLPLLAIDFAANGGTNFSKLELIRNKKLQDFYSDVVALGHTAEEMVTFLNESVEKLGNVRKCNNVIISGGVKNFLDGYYYITKCELDAAYGQAAPFLKYANESQEALDEFAEFQIQGLLMAQRLLRVK